MPPSLLEQLAAELASMPRVAGQGVPRWGERHTQPTGTPSLPYMHGPNGLWSVPGVSRDVISTRVQPRGLAGMLPAVGTRETDPFFAYLTGFLTGSGSNPNGICDDAPTAGPMKNCIQTAQFGRYQLSTREFELVIPTQIINRSEPQDLNILNDPLLSPGFNNNGIIMPGVTGNISSELATRFTELGVGFQNLLSRQLYIGNPANNTAGGGYREFPGLDLLISTNKKDAVTGQLCPSLNSMIQNFGYRLVSDQSIQGDIVRWLTYMLRVLNSNAERSGLSPVNFALVMREGLFYELTAVWPCSYMTYGCQMRSTAGDQTLSLDGGDMIAMRDNMRNGQYLLIDGKQVAVIFDDAIPEQTNTTAGANVPSGMFASDIYILPMTFMGGMPGIYWQYFDMSAAVAMAQAGNVGQYFWTDGGRYIWHAKPPKNWCVQWQTRIEPRIILPVPHLAGKLRNVRYSPLMHTRDAFPDQPYFVNGGVTSRTTAPSSWADYKG